MKFYLQVNQENIITDAITYKQEGYVEITINTLPIGVSGGWFKLEGGLIVEYLELKPKDEMQELKARLQSTEDALMFLMDMQMGGF